MKTIFILALALLAAPASAAQLAAVGEEESVAERMSRDETARAQAIASRYGASERDVRSLRAMGMGWGEVENALAISRVAGRPLTEVVEARESGMDFNEIAGQYGYTLSEIHAEPPSRRPQPKEDLRDSVKEPPAKGEELRDAPKEPSPAESEKSINEELLELDRKKNPSQQERRERRNPHEGRVDSDGERGLVPRRPY